MSFDKYMGKERRKPYYRRGKHATTCRPHGGCPYCLNDRMYQQTKAKMYADMEIKEWCSIGAEKYSIVVDATVTSK